MSATLVLGGPPLLLTPLSIGGQIADVAGAVVLLLGALLTFAAAVGVLRLPDALSRMHAATKPQTLGLLLILVGVGVTLRNPHVLGLLVLIGVLQLLTAPVAGHMVSRTGYRTRQLRAELLVRDELADDLAAAGFRLVQERTGRDGELDTDNETVDHDGAERGRNAPEPG